MEDVGVSGPFRATQIWYKIIDCLHNGVIIKRHRHKFFKQYDNVFAGNNAVDVIYLFLQQMGNEIANQEITRENAIKVCQVLMDNFIFEPVPFGSTRFEDSCRCFYRFVEQNTESTEDKCETTTSPLNEASNRGYQSTSPVNGDSQSCPTSIIASNRQLSPLLLAGKRRHSFMAAIRTNNTLMDGLDKKRVARKSHSGIFKNNSLRMSLLKHKPRYNHSSHEFVQKINTDVSDISEELINSVRDRALCYLLTLIDIPILEAILSTSVNMSRVLPYEDALTIENESTKTNDSPQNYPLVKEFEWMPWVKAATACLTYIPNGIGGLWSIQACKLQSYKEVVEHYQNLLFPLLPDTLLPLYTSILELCKTSKYSTTQKALQLLMTFLPWQRRDQLHKLLLFLHIVVQDLSVTIEKRLTNNEVVLRDFTDCILYHSLISKECRTSFLSLLLSNINIIFQFPHWIHCSDISFCQKVPLSILQNHYFTVQALEELFNIITKSTFSDKKKSTWIRKFKKMHYELYIRLFDKDNL